MKRLVHWIPSTKDKKTGEVLVSYSTIDTCPDSCSLKEGGCYAWGLFYLKILSNRLSDGRTNPTSLSDAIKGIKKSCKIARHRIAGDIVGDVKDTLLECIEIERNGLINIGYTHNWRDPESEPMKKYFRASCENIDDVIEARKNGWAVSLIVPKGTPKKITLPNNETAFMCPARHGEEGKRDITCNDCTLCKVNEKTESKTVMFEAHGSKATLNKINKVIK
jgi:hypothetical protein